MPVGLQPMAQKRSPSPEMRPWGHAHPRPMPVFAADSRPATAPAKSNPPRKSGIASIRVARRFRILPLSISGSSMSRPSWSASRRLFMRSLFATLRSLLVTFSVDSKCSEEPGFDNVGEPAIEHEETGNPRPVDGRQRHEAEEVSRRAVGEHGADGHDQPGEEEHDRAGAALDEGNLPCPDDVHDQG